jgi:hypothetical protein
VPSAGRTSSSNFSWTRSSFTRSIAGGTSPLARLTPAIAVTRVFPRYNDVTALEIGRKNHSRSGPERDDNA